MYIKSIELVGFKSYGKRVLISGFDPEFNAITGLNGTGKSNILDAICFVFGITNLSNVRANSLQELIYKQGQGGITLASVTVVFDNTNKAQQPIGYHNDEISVYRQVNLGGKTKYKINGYTVQNKRVSDLFCSVHLNVNNPHFLIMQGRITKVLSMKPAEILSLVEEAAGTKMYEAKKLNAEKIIQKKDEKLRELNNIIQEDIAPKIQKLQEERSQFQEYQKVIRELENLNKLYTAYKYVTLEQNTKEQDKKLQEMQEQIKKNQDVIKAEEEEMKKIDEKIAEMNAALDEESGSALARLAAELGALERAEAGAAAEARAAADAEGALRRRARLQLRAHHADRDLLRDKEAQLLQLTSSFAGEAAARAAAEAALAAAQQRLLSASSGHQDADTLQDRLMAAKQQASEAATRVSQAAMELEHAKKRLRTLQADFKQGAAHYRRDNDTLVTQQKQIDDVQAQMSALQVSAERSARLRAAVRELQRGVRTRRDAADTLAARLPRAHFRCQLPPGLAPGAVAGTLCSLIEVVDPAHCTAVETVAGGKLYNVVVDTEVTSKLLLQHGNLQTRTTFIPLNKIVPREIDPKILAAAQEIGGGAACVAAALALVRCGAGAAAAAAWALGGALVCRDLRTARRVTFHARVRTRAVTLDGDLCDPQGTLSGGAPLQGGSVLAQLAELRSARAALAEAEAELERESAALLADQQLSDRYHALQQRYEMLCHELEVVKSRIATSSHGQLHAEIESLQKQISELTEAMERDKAIQKEAADQAATLEAQVKDIKSHREREYKKAEQELKAAKQEFAQYGEKWQSRAQEVESLRLETSELRAAVEAGVRQQEEGEAAAAALAERVAATARELAEHSERTQQVQARMQRLKEELAERSGEVRRLQAGRERHAGGARAAALAVKDLELKLQDLQAEASRAAQQVEKLVQEHPWILSEREYFGLAGGLYDFAGRQAESAGARLVQLTERRDKLARGVNARAHTLLSMEEEQYQDLLRKKGIVEADRRKLVQVMVKLDEKKRRTLLVACESVNKDFGVIFSMLLPGAQARLQPPAGATVLEGLELAVGFNGTWKESLGELSGGQRSLVALSLVLAMLLFKPAPLYILDEVDAALDLSHTQNIGLILKKYFQHSQFLIVSLKEGMFNNANVLFRTQFVDGMSTVQRVQNDRARR